MANMRGENSRPGKRPLRALSATEKIDAIARVHDGESKASVARDIGVPESTLRGWCKSELKLRGIARNSSTPDSEAAQSPASSSGNNQMSGVGTSNVSSDEDVAGPSTSKKPKLEPLPTQNDGLTEQQKQQQEFAKKSSMDYIAMLNNIVASGMAVGRPEANALLLQQLSLLNAQNAANMTKNLLSLSGTGLATAHLAGVVSPGVVPQTVGLVENGLQYTKTSGGNSSRRSTSHISTAIAPSQFDSVNRSRKSLPPAAEAPTTPVPVSPRKSTEYQLSSNGALNLQNHNRNSTKRDNGCSSSSSSSTNSARKAHDEALMMWLAQQQQMIGQQAAAAATLAAAPGNGVDPVGSWFWQWYKQCTYPLAAPTPIAACSTAASLPHQQNLTYTSPATFAPTVQPTAQPPRKSPSKAKASLDNVLCINNNNNENVHRSYNANSDNSEPMELDPAELASTEAALDHGEKFFKWLSGCSDPSVTQVQIMQLKNMLENLRRRKIGSRRSKN